jgi:hypothetical protein
MAVEKNLWFRKISASAVDLTMDFTGGVMGSYFGAMVAALVTAMKSGAPEQMEHSVKSGFGLGFAFWALSVSFVNRVLIQGISRASIGKKLFKLEVISTDAPLTWTSVMSRWILSIGSIAVGGAGYWYAFFNEEGKSFHDFVMKMDVVPEYEGASMKVEYREDARSFEEIRHMTVMANMTAERPLGNLIRLPVKPIEAQSPAATGTYSVIVRSLSGKVFTLHSRKEKAEKKAA